jgi:hypothetical protein
MPTATNTPEPTATDAATPSPTSTATLEPTATATDTPEPTATATPTVQPTPPAGLPPAIELGGTNYVFDEVVVDVEIEELIEVETIESAETPITVYVAPEEEPGPASLVYLVPAGTDVVAVYVPSVGGTVPSTGSGSGLPRSDAGPWLAALLVAAVALSLLLIRMAAGRR